MNKRELLKSVMPYALVRWLHYRRKFNLDIRMEGEFPDCGHKHKTIVSVDGLGYSGHTALADLLLEYSSIKTPTIDISGIKDFPHYEFNFMRLAGCPMELEQLLELNNLMVTDAALHRMKLTLEDFPFIQRNSNLYKYTSLYLSKLIDIVLPDLSMKFMGGQLHKDDMCTDNSIYIMKNMGVQEFRNLTRQYLTAFCNEFYEEGKDVLALNHFFTDEYNIERRNAFIPGVKALNIYRDPRDIYFFAKTRNVEWIAHDTVENFVKWAKNRYSQYDKNSTDYLPIRFEELILKYDEVVADIERYIGVSPESHVYKKRNLDPAVSIKNVGIWKSDASLSDEMKYIDEQLHEFCYHG